MRKIAALLIILMVIGWFPFNAAIPENPEVSKKLENLIKRKPNYDPTTGLYLLYNGEKSGLADFNGNIIVPIEWESFSMNWVTDYGFIVGNRKGKETIFDVKNQKEIPIVLFDKLSMCIGDAYYYDKDHCYFVVEKNGRQGVWRVGDTSLLVPCQYDEIVFPQISSVEYWPVKNNKGIGLYGKGKEIVPCGQYTLIRVGHKGEFALVSDTVTATYCSQSNPSGLIGKGKFGIFDLTTGKAGAIEYDAIGYYGEGCLGYNKGGTFYNGNLTGGKWGFIDIKGNKLSDAIYDEISCVEDGAARVIKNGVHELFISPLENYQTADVVSKVDINIPSTGIHEENTFVFIIANENYINLPNSEYSINDGEIFKKYCVSSFGIEESNIFLLTDATYGNIMSIINRIEDISDVYEGEAAFIIYFTGLGSVNSSLGARLLLPVDANINIAETMIDINDLFNRLSKCPAKEYLCIFDSPFNGEDRKGNPLTTGRGIALKNKVERPENISVVMAGEEGNGNAYDELQHGLLTYCLLDIVQENQYDSIHKAIESLAKEVKRKSFENYNKIQTVTVF